jgi:drug/metabolite transporter (DMT)-like permease
MTDSPPNHLRAILLTTLTMLCFATNSILARLALREQEIDAGTFTAVRIMAGALVLVLLTSWQQGRLSAAMVHGSWRAAVALFGYAAAFSFAYLWLDAGVGALILFATVQITMIGVGMLRGERPLPAEWFGLALAMAGLVYLVSPDLTTPGPAPSLPGAALMAVSGIAWGSYSLAAKGTPFPTAATAANFVRAVPFAGAILLAVWLADRPHASQVGLGLAMISGGVTSGLGYTIWYMALRDLSASRAAIVQLTVPVIAAVAGVVLLDEHMTLRLAFAGAAILGGVALALTGKRKLDRKSQAS